MNHDHVSDALQGQRSVRAVNGCLGPGNYLVGSIKTTGTSALVGERGGSLLLQPLLASAPLCAPMVVPFPGPESGTSFRPKILLRTVRVFFVVLVSGAGIGHRNWNQIRSRNSADQRAAERVPVAAALAGGPMSPSLAKASGRWSPRDNKADARVLVAASWRVASFRGRPGLLHAKASVRVPRVCGSAGSKRPSNQACVCESASTWWGRPLSTDPQGGETFLHMSSQGCSP